MLDNDVETPYHAVDLLGFEQSLCSFTSSNDSSIASAPSNLGGTFTDLNRLEFIGEVDDIAFSSNALHLFAAVSRNLFDISSSARYSEICKRLSLDPDDDFLGDAFRDACDQSGNIYAATHQCLCSSPLYSFISLPFEKKKKNRADSVRAFNTSRDPKNASTLVYICLF